MRGVNRPSAPTARHSTQTTAPQNPALSPSPPALSRSHAGSASRASFRGRGGPHAAQPPTSNRSPRSPSTLAPTGSFSPRGGQAAVDPAASPPAAMGRERSGRCEVSDYDTRQGVVWTGIPAPVDSSEVDRPGLDCRGEVSPRGVGGVALQSLHSLSGAGRGGAERGEVVTPNACNSAQDMSHVCGNSQKNLSVPTALCNSMKKTAIF